MAANCTDVPRGFNTYNWRLIITDTEGLSPKIISTRNSVFADPAWSPNGNKIVYVSLPPGLSASSSQNLYEIYVADYNESTNTISNEVRLTNDKLYCFDPCWSPDGQYIAFTTCRYVNTPFNSEIIRIKPDGSDKMTIMNDNLSNAVPYWTEDSKRVYFHTLGIGTSYSIASCDAVNGGDKQIHLLGGGNTITYYTTPQPVNH
ncbi:MAG: hypothetical protein K1X55_08045 [Chitinophagales bacterium]|nr:hypothetical protein [Chitinophagales bacterium]